MSDQKSNLFSDPVITSSDDFDKDFDLTNEMDIDLEKVSLYDSNENSNTPITEENSSDTKIFDYVEPEITEEVEVKTIPLDQDLNINNENTFDESGLFQEETVPNLKQEVNTLYHTEPLDIGSINSGTKVIKDSYEDEPKTSYRKWIIFTLIGAVVALCAGWFVFSLLDTKNESTTLPQVTEDTTDTIKPNRIPNNNSSTNNNDNYSTDSEATTESPDNNYYYDYDYDDYPYEDEIIEEYPSYDPPIYEEPENEEDLKDYHEPDYENWSPYYEYTEYEEYIEPYY